MRIFWSWQADLDKKTGQYFVRDALKEAADLLHEDLGLDEAERLDVDHDTKDVPGTPPIVETIFNKIADAAIFVADATPVGRTASGKALLNPNVMIELGFARQALGYHRIVLVANSEHLSNIEELPFDLRGDRGPITYRLASGAAGAAIKEAKKILVAQLKTSLAAIIKHHLDQAAAQTLTTTQVETDKRTKWFGDDEMLSHVDTYSQNAETKVRVVPGPHAFMRIRPSFWPADIRSSSLLPSGQHQKFVVLGRASNGDYGQTESGILQYWFYLGEGGTRNADAIAKWDSSTGEIWMVWPGLVVDHEGKWFDGFSLMKKWGKSLRTAIEQAAMVGARPPFRIDAGVVGIKNTRWAMHITRGAVFSSNNEVRLTSSTVTTDHANQRQFLASLFNRLTDSFGFPEAMTDEQVQSIIEQP